MYFKRFLGLPMQNSHVILIIVMATHCPVCGSRMQQLVQHCGLICAAGALSHEKSHSVNLIGAPEIRTATSSSPRNRSKYTRPSLVPRPNPHAGKRVWCTSSNFLGFQDAKPSCDINYCHGNALSGMRVAHVTTLWPHLRRWCAVT